MHGPSPHSECCMADCVFWFVFVFWTLFPVIVVLTCLEIIFRVLFFQDQDKTLKILRRDQHLRNSGLETTRLYRNLL